MFKILSCDMMLSQLYPLWTFIAIAVGTGQAIDPGTDHSARTCDIQDTGTSCSEPGLAEDSYSQSSLNYVTKHENDVTHPADVANDKLLQMLFNVASRFTTKMKGAESGDSLVDVLDLHVFRGRLKQPGLISEDCRNDMTFLLKSIVQGQEWALQFLDATGRPGPALKERRYKFLGDYSYCLGLVAPPGHSFTGSYHTLRVAMGTPFDPFWPKTNRVFQLGVCVPSTCTEDDNTALVDQVIQSLALNTTDLPLFVMETERHTEERHVTMATKLSLGVISVIGGLMFLGTLYDLLQLKQTGQARSEPSSASVLARGDVLTTSKQRPGNTGKCAQALLAFSVYSNGARLLSTCKAPGTISCIDGLRFFSLGWVVLGHTFAFCVDQIDNFHTEINYLLKQWSFNIVANSTVAVDTFFTIGGLLVSYLTVKEMTKKGWRINWSLFYFHRYWRLTPPYLLFLVISLGLHQYCGHGPLWSKIQPPDRDYCESSWWANMLYINNMVQTNKPCLPHTWYLAVDMQCYLVAPLLIIPFYFHAGLGFAVCIIVILASMIIAGAVTLAYNLPSTALLLWSFISDYHLKYYTASWCRIGPYTVGIMTGYVLARWRDDVKLSRNVAIVGWTLATVAMIFSIYGIHGDISEEKISSPEAAALYNALIRTVWGVCICWIVVACETGCGGVVNSFLTWSPFTVLSRVAYMGFLIHLNVVFIFFQNQQTLYHLTAVNIVFTYLGVMVIVLAASFVFTLALESPMAGLEKILLPGRRKH